MAPHHKTISTLPQGEREIPSECRYMNQCTNVPNGQTQTYKVESVNALNANRHKSIFIIGVLFLPVDFSRHPYNGALLCQYNHCTQDAGSTTSRPRSSRHADTAIALRGFSTTTAAHALRFYTEARFPSTFS